MAPGSRTASQERWLRFFNDVFYDALAPAYDAMDLLTFGAWWRLVRRALEHVPDEGRLLEVGFGPGRLHVELARRSAVCVGLDLSPGMCRRTLKRLRKARLEPKLTRGSAFQLPYPNDCFDTVVSTFALSGLPDLDDAMHELARVTRPCGRVVVVDIALPRDGNRLGSRLARLWERMGDFLYDYEMLMEKAALEVETCQEFGPGLHIRSIVGIKPATPSSASP